MCAGDVDLCQVVVIRVVWCLFVKGHLNQGPGVRVYITGGSELSGGRHGGRIWVEDNCISGKPCDSISIHFLFICRKSKMLFISKSSMALTGNHISNIRSI